MSAPIISPPLPQSSTLTQLTSPHSCPTFHLDINSSPTAVSAPLGHRLLPSSSSCRLLQLQQFLDHTMTHKPLFLALFYCPSSFTTCLPCPPQTTRATLVALLYVYLQLPDPHHPLLYSASKTLSLVQTKPPLAPGLHLAAKHDQRNYHAHWSASIIIANLKWAPSAAWQSL